MGNKTFTIQNSFTAGEISERLIARTDLEFYRSGAKTMRNIYNLAHGGAKRRPGTVFVAEINDSTQEAKLIPFIYSRTLSYMLVLNGGQIEFVKDGQFVLNAGSPATRYQVACPYTEAELPQLKYAQVGNTLFFAHPNHPPRKLKRGATDTDWTLSTIDFTYDAITDSTYENYWLRFKIVSGGTKFVKGDSFTIAATSGTVTPGTNTGNGTIVGVQFTTGAPTETWTITCNYVDNDKQKWTVTGSTSGKMVGMFYTGNYPAAVSAFEQRLYWAGTTRDPNVVWGSVIGIYEDLTVGATDDMGVMFRIDSNTYETILHLQSTKQLLPMSYGGEFSITGGSKSITSTNFKITPQTFHGSSDVKPVRVADEILFVQRGEKKIRALSYNLATDINTAPDITILATDITQNSIKDMTFAAEPDFIVWSTTRAGELLSTTHLREFNTTGWAKHTTDGTFENLSTIPNGSIDQTYLVIKRTINNQQKRYLEYLDYVDGAQTDSALFGQTGSPAQTVWSGLDHLEGKTVDVIADGAVHPQVTVSGGSITLQAPASTIEVGLPYTSTLELLHPDVQLADGTSQGRAVSFSELVIRVQDTLGLTVNDVDYTFRDFADPLDTPVPKYTGDITVNMLGWDSPNNVKLEQKLPLPMQILGVVNKLVVNE